MTQSNVIPFREAPLSIRQQGILQASPSCWRLKQPLFLDPVVFAARCWVCVSGLNRPAF